MKSKYIKIIDNPKIKTSTLMKKLEDNFKVYSYWDSEELDKNFLPPKEKTVRYFKKQQEPDMLGKSADDVKDIPTMTFREYILFFIAYYKETGEYADKKGLTITSSRLAGGNAALGYWLPDDVKVKLRYDYGDYRNDNAGPREAFSLESSNLVPSAMDTSDVKEKGEAFIKALQELMKSL